MFHLVFNRESCSHVEGVRGMRLYGLELGILHILLIQGDEFYSL
jgi:hypothetical protein